MGKDFIFCLWLLPIIWLFAWTKTNDDDEITNLLAATLVAVVFDAILYCLIHAIRIAIS